MKSVALASQQFALLSFAARACVYFPLPSLGETLGKVAIVLSSEGKPALTRGQVLRIGPNFASCDTQSGTKSSVIVIAKVPIPSISVSECSSGLTLGF